MAKVRGLITSSIGFAASSGVGSYFARGVRVRRCVENESLAANTVDHRRFFGSRLDLPRRGVRSLILCCDAAHAGAMDTPSIRE
jgi:hypothetical protein